MAKTTSGGDENEPKENDKCITPPSNAGNGGTGGSDNGVGHTNEHVKKSKMSAFHDRLDSAKVVIDTRYKLIITILSILILVLLIIVIALSISLGSSSKKEANTCVSASCLAAAARVVRSLNSSVNPCEDIWSHTCGGWIRDNPLEDNDGYRSVRTQVDDQVNRDIRHYIDLIKETDDNKPQWKIKRFYHSCMDVEDIDITYFKRKIYDIGGWALQNTYSKSKWDLDKALLKLHTEYGVSPFFRVYVDTDDTSPTNAIIKYVDAYRKLMQDIAMDFDVTSSKAETFSIDMFEFEKRLATRMPTIEEWQSPKKYKKMRVKDLNNMVALKFKWTDLLQSIYQKAGIKENTYILVAFENYFKEVAELISTTEERVRNNYVVWRFIYDYLPYLPKKFLADTNLFDQKMRGITKTNHNMGQERWEFCIRTTMKFMGDAVGSLYVKNKIISNPKLTYDAKQIATSLANTLLNHVASFRWVRDEVTAKHIREKIQILIDNIDTGFPQFIVNEDSLQKYYSDLIVQKGFLNNIFEAYFFIRKKEEQRLLSPTTLSNSWRILATDVAAQYKNAGNQLMIASGLMNLPFFDRDLPVPIKFGALGFQIASEMLKSLSLPALNYDELGKLIDPDSEWISPKSLESVNASQHCIAQEIELQNRVLNDASYEVNPELTTSFTSTDIAALQIAYRSFIDHLNKNNERGLMPGISIDNDRLFFISLSQAMCESVRPGFAPAAFSSRTTLPAERRVKILFEQVPQFSSAFGCTQKSHHCRIWL
ncbi:Endothelin-converting enzyme 2-like protein [Dinothrombium tinctorium]|uniref:Endothelin-converting enzyme 2-like protein n=1 Tax=Dinothrombium tinctorium TaxID=1965070 RepID=A0A3S3PIN1_9ACAR|nr:Endothelin-converting enzyme 2-like protein [Dinothrombium tinctorium]RWS10480.1 Endothelin-converting enzyme 2-like protein [Dinothrombium tinctorium]RWS10980.1 Endothelin-converting enzyme 2-like protein [Dinothrombium tinctorium]